MELMGVLLSLLLIAAMVGLPILGVVYLASSAKNAILGGGRRGMSQADRARLQRDDAHAAHQELIAYRAQAARAEAEAARQSALQRAQSTQQTTQKWV